MGFLADLVGGAGSGVLGSLIGSLAGLGTAFVKLKTLKETNKHTHAMSLLAGKQEVERALAALKVVEVDGAIATDLAIEATLQESYEHDAPIGAWAKGRDLGKVSTFFLVLGDFVKTMMRPVLTTGAIVYVFVIFQDYMDLVGPDTLSAEQLASMISMLTSAIIVLATTAFTWWFADRSVSKAMTAKLLT